MVVLAVLSSLLGKEEEESVEIPCARGEWSKTRIVPMRRPRM